jgi:hypothetical protein
MDSRLDESLPPCGRQVDNLEDAITNFKSVLVEDEEVRRGRTNTQREIGKRTADVQHPDKTKLYTSRRA